ncbi:hydrolase 1, exosortase A system-associated [uncultured Sphingomonas sp.]|uniref:hydrolase 1, exosortase A system-associated n=1 Tax=uncultured Sphingomonas sp. TaxID=158754 RepID=UPI00262E6D7B|nr:hydrolase 1, exosortase A system-associated [uncultured Sphingomonas sp.]
MDRRVRRLIAFPCGGDTLIGSLDEAPGATGLLIVSGGNEIRAGAHRGMAMLAATLAAEGVPVFRYDRRGIGDSSGENRGFYAARDDLLAAAAAFRAEAPHITRLTGFGNCDAATTLALHGKAAGIARVLLANPWVIEPVDGLPPPAAIRAHYAARLRDPATWRRALSGGVSIGKFIRGLRRISDGSTEAGSLAATALPAIAGWGSKATVILAEGDATAIAYADAAKRAAVAPRTIVIPSTSHSFARQADAAALAAAIRDLVNACE